VKGVKDDKPFLVLHDELAFFDKIFEGSNRVAL